jgi:hypothetical protein
MKTVSTTLVSVGPLCGAGEAARAAGSAATAVARFSVEASSRAESRMPDPAIATASAK